MTGFVLVDLRSQYDEVVKHVEGMSPDEVLEWMRHYGTVRKIEHESDDALYSFYSEAGRGTAFRFDENGGLIIFHR